MICDSRKYIKASQNTRNISQNLTAVLYKEMHSCNAEGDL